MQVPMGTVLEGHARTFPHRVAIRCDDEALTYPQLSEVVERAAGELRRAGVGAGDVVAVALPNGVDFLVATFAAWRLDVFMQDEEFLLLEDVSAFTGIPRSTAFRILSQLTALDWLEHGPRGFRLGTRAHGLASRTRHEYDDVRGAVGVALNELHAATGAVAHLGVLEGGRVRYLDKIGGAAASTVPSRIGGRLHADTTTCGKALLACLAPEHVDSLIKITSARRHRTPDLPTLHRQLGFIRRQHGLAVDSADKCPTGIAAIAAPIVGPHGAVGAISLAGRHALQLERVAPMVARAARQASASLFAR